VIKLDVGIVVINYTTLLSKLKSACALFEALKGYESFKIMGESMKK